MPIKNNSSRKGNLNHCSDTGNWFYYWHHGSLYDSIVIPDRNVMGSIQCINTYIKVEFDVWYFQLYVFRTQKLIQMSSRSVANV